MNNFERQKRKLIKYEIDEYRIWNEEILQRKLEDSDEIPEMMLYGAYSIFIAYINSKTGYDCDDIAIELSCLRENNRVDCFDDIELNDDLIVSGFYILENKVVIAVCDRENEEADPIYFWIDNKWNEK